MERVTGGMEPHLRATPSSALCNISVCEVLSQAPGSGLPARRLAPYSLPLADTCLCFLHFLMGNTVTPLPSHAPQAYHTVSAQRLAP